MGVPCTGKAVLECGCVCVGGGGTFPSQPCHHASSTLHSTPLIIAVRCLHMLLLCVCVAGAVFAALRSNNRMQTWCFVAADLVYFFIAVRYVYVTWKVARAIKPEALAASATLRRAVYGFAGASVCACEM